MRITCLNLQHGGARRVSGLLRYLLDSDSDVLVLSEFRWNATGQLIVAELGRQGYAATHPVLAPSKNTVLIASRHGIDSAGPMLEDDGQHAWFAATADLGIVAVYLPNGKQKLPYWDGLIAAASENRADLFIGDFNTGDNLLDRVPGTVAFIGADRFHAMSSAGAVDVWRTRNPDVTEYSWWSHTGNGFRIDHAFMTTAAAGQVVDVSYDRTPKTSGISDHATLTVELSRSVEAKTMAGSPDEWA